MPIANPKIVAVISRKNGVRFGKDEVSPYLIDYALHNREDFLIVYEDEKQEPTPVIEEKKVKDVFDSSPRFTREELSRMNKANLQELANSFNLVYEGETKEVLIDLLLKAQED